MKRLLTAILTCLAMLAARPTFAREFDVETGLVHMGARDYDPSTGRFLQEDPELPYSDGAMLQPKNLNLYAYAWNSPLRYIDPLGTLPMDSPGWDRYSAAMMQAYPHSCLAKCVDEHLLGISAAGLTGIGTARVPKPWTWKNASESSNIMRDLLIKAHGGRDIPLGCRVPVVRSSYLFGTMGRLNLLASSAITGYEAGAATMCTQACARGDILSPYYPRQ